MKKAMLSPFWMKVFVKLVAAVLTFTFTISGLFIVIYYKNGKNALDELMENTVCYVKKNLSGLLDSYSNTVGNMNVSYSIYEIEYEMGKNKTFYKSAEKFGKIFGNIYSETDGLASLCYVDKRGKFLNIGARITAGKAEELNKKCSETKTYNKTGEMWFYDEEYLVLCKKIIYISDGYRVLEYGYVLLFFNIDKINEKNFEGFGGNNFNIIFEDCFGAAALCSERGRIGKKYKSDTEEKNIKIGYETELDNPSGWKCGVYTGNFAVYGNFGKIIFIVILIDLLCLIITLIFLRLLLKKISEPIKMVVDMLNEISSNPGKAYSGDNEMLYIKEAVNELAENLREEVKKSYLLKEKMNGAAMKVYESQMNSHFLFNTLQLIQMMSRGAER